MIATLNSYRLENHPQPFPALKSHVQEIKNIIFAVIFVALIISAQAEQTSPDRVTPFAARAQKAFRVAQATLRAEPKNAEAALRFGQAAFDWAEFAEDNKLREEIALEGIDACRRVIASQPKAAAGHYYLAMNLGQLARTKTLGALRLVSEMETEFSLARGLDEKLDFAGPDRNLGMLYAEAPGWPTSIGNRSKARHHLQRAILLQPNYPENHLNLLEAYLKWGDKTGAEQEFKALTELWPIAKKEFTGEQWESSWADWTKHWEKIQTEFAETRRILESPHNKR